MGNRLKEFLFPSKDKNEFETTTVEISKENIIDKKNEVNNNQNIVGNNSSPLILSPKTFMEVENVAVELLSNHTVIVDLTATNNDEAKRICDFLNGVTYAINGQVKKVAKLIYMFSPQDK